jgi:hypothetical protein
MRGLKEFDETWSGRTVTTFSVLGLGSNFGHETKKKPSLPRRKVSFFGQLSVVRCQLLMVGRVGHIADH